jgi:hypothetical protein
VTKPSKLIYDDAAHAYWLDGKRWSGASGYGGQIENQSALINWGKRQAARGVALDDKLRQQVLLHLDDDAKLDRLAEQALTVAGANASRDRGSEIHRITEQHDKGALLLLTDDMADIVKRWQDVLAAHDITLDPDYIERIVVAPEFRVCGTFDRLAWHRGRRVVLDLKTGKNTRYRHTMCVQLALLANAEWITHSGFVHGEKTTFTQFDPMPEVDTEVGLIVSMPSDGSEPAVYELPIVDGLRAARLAKEAKQWTATTVGTVLAASTATPPASSPPTRAGGTSTAATTSPPADGDAKRSWLAERLEHVKRNPQATQMLQTAWTDNRLPRWTECTDDHYDTVATMLDLVEKWHELPFTPEPYVLPDLPPEPTPKPSAEDVADMDPTEVDELLAAVKADPEVHAFIDRIIAARGPGVPAFSPKAIPCRRRYEIVRAMKAWAYVSDEVGLRAGLTVVLGDDAMQNHTTGALLSALTVEEATHLAGIAEGVGVDSLMLDRDGDGLIVRKVA